MWSCTTRDMWSCTTRDMWSCTTRDMWSCTTCQEVQETKPSQYIDQWTKKKKKNYENQKSGSHSLISLHKICSKVIKTVAEISPGFIGHTRLEPCKLTMSLCGCIRTLSQHRSLVPNHDHVAVKSRWRDHATAKSRWLHDTPRQRKAPASCQKCKWYKRTCAVVPLPTVSKGKKLSVSWTDWHVDIISHPCTVLVSAFFFLHVNGGVFLRFLIWEVKQDMRVLLRLSIKTRSCRDHCSIPLLISLLITLTGGSIARQYTWKSRSGLFRQMLHLSPHFVSKKFNLLVPQPLSLKFFPCSLQHIESLR